VHVIGVHVIGVHVIGVQCDSVTMFYC